MALDKELATYKDRLDVLKEHAGKFVLIRGDEVIDCYVAYDDALKAGYQRFKLEPFLVKQIEAVESVQHFTRHMTPIFSARA